MGAGVEEKIVSLATELKDLLTNHLLKDPKIAESYMERAASIRREIQSMGFLVTWSFSLNSETFTGEADVNIYKVKENLSPEDQEIYDGWLMKQAGIKI